MTEQFQGDPKKMNDSVLRLSSFLKVGIFFSTCFLDSEFHYRFIETPVSSEKSNCRTPVKIFLAFFLFAEADVMAD